MCSSDSSLRVGDRVQLLSEFGAYWPPLIAGHAGMIIEIHLDLALPYLVKLDGAGEWLFDRAELTPEAR